MTYPQKLYLIRMALPGRACSLSAAECQQAIDRMEETIPHDELPSVYDYLVERRDALKAGRRTYCEHCPAVDGLGCCVCGNDLEPLTVASRVG